MPGSRRSYRKTRTTGNAVAADTPNAGGAPDCRTQRLERVCADSPLILASDHRGAEGAVIVGDTTPSVTSWRIRPPRLVLARLHLSFAKTTSDSFNAPKILPPFQDCELFGDALPDYLYSQADGTSHGRPSDGSPRRERGSERVARAFGDKSTELDYAARLT